MSTAATLEAQIRANRLLNVPVAWDDEVIFPYYDGLSLYNVPHSVASLLGAPLAESAPLSDAVWQGASPQAQVDRVVLFLMDGMGYQHLNMLIAEDSAVRAAVDDLSAGRGAVPLTSVAPSTTAVALTTLWTGGTPGATAMLGTLMFLREFHTLADMLTFRPVKGKHAPDVLADWGLSPADIVDKPGIGEHLAAQGIETHLILERSLKGTGLSRILHRGISHHHPHLGYSDMMLRFEQVLVQTKGQRCYVGLYWPALDSLAHAYGAHNRFTHTEIRTQLLALVNLLNNPAVQDGRTLFILVADHGHFDAFNAIDTGQDVVLREAKVFGLSGDARLPHLYLRSGTEERVKQHIDQTYPDSLTYIERDTALQRGFFGNQALSPKTAARVGDLILVPRLGWTVDDPSVGKPPLISWHAGLTDWEMLIPFVWKLI